SRETKTIYWLNRAAFILSAPMLETHYQLQSGASARQLTATFICYDEPKLVTHVKLRRSVSRVSCAHPPTRGLPTTTWTWDDQHPRWLAARATYDHWGNKLSDTDQRGYTTTYAFDSVHFHPKLECNALKQCTRFGRWDTVADAPTTITDPNHARTTYN